jgi:hypothetical protein
MCSFVPSINHCTVQPNSAPVLAPSQDGLSVPRKPCITSAASPADDSVKERLSPDHVFADLTRNGYRCLLIDPPTRFVAGTKGRPQHYNRMTDADIAALPVADLLHPEGAWIFLWVTSPKLYAPTRSRTHLSPDNVARAWGARYSGRAFVWIKTKALATAPIIHPRPPKCRLWSDEPIASAAGFESWRRCQGSDFFFAFGEQRTSSDIRRATTCSE